MRLLTQMWRIAGKSVSFYIFIATAVWASVQAWAFFDPNSLQQWLQPYWKWIFLGVPATITMLRVAWYVFTHSDERITPMSKSEIIQLLCSESFTYQQIAFTLVPSLGYRLLSLTGPNSSHDELVINLVNQAIADNKCSKLLQEMRKLKEHLAIPQECQP